MARSHRNLELFPGIEKLQVRRYDSDESLAATSVIVLTAQPGHKVRALKAALERRLGLAEGEDVGA